MKKKFYKCISPESDPKGIIWWEILNGYELGYPELPNFTDPKEWVKFDGILYLQRFEGKKFVDVMGTSGPDFIISERVKEIFEKEGFTGYKLYNVEFPKEKKVPCKYYGMIATGRNLRVDDEKMIEYYNKTGEIKRDLFRVHFEDYDGSDFFTMGNSTQITMLEKTYKKIEKYKIENLLIKELEYNLYDEKEEKEKKKGFLEKLFKKED